MQRNPVYVGFLILLAFVSVGRGADDANYAISLYGPDGIALGADEPFPYVNTEAPKGGRLVMSGQNFTTLNPYSLKGLG